MAPLSLALVDDYEVVVHGLAAMIRNYRERVRVVELDTNLDVAEHVDIALYDSFANPQGDSVQVRDLAANPRIGKTIVYTWNFDDHRISRAFANGADGYISKGLSAARLVDALESVHRGDQAIHPVDGGETKIVAGDWPGREEGLTPREAEVLALITQGLSNAEIAERSALSINSIKTHIRNCYRRIGVTTRTQAVLWGVAHGFVPDRSRKYVDET